MDKLISIVSVKGKPLNLLLALWFSLILVAGLGWFSKAQDRLSFSPAEVKEGWRVFYQKGCFECHSLWGEGGK